jgi:hypothetical protein
MCTAVQLEPKVSFGDLTLYLTYAAGPRYYITHGGTVQYRVQGEPP